MKKNAKKRAETDTAINFEFAGQYDVRNTKLLEAPRISIFCFHLNPKKLEIDRSMKRVKIDDVKLSEPTLEKAYEEVTSPGGAAHPPLLHESGALTFAQWHQKFGWLGHTGKAIQSFLREMEGWPGSKRNSDK
jgi:hypothetical protein